MRLSIVRGIELAILLAFAVLLLQPGRVPDPLGVGPFWSWTVVCAATVILLAPLQRLGGASWTFHPLDGVLAAYVAVALVFWPFSQDPGNTGRWISTLAVQVLLYWALRASIGGSELRGRAVIAAVIVGIAWIQLEALDYHVFVGLSERTIAYSRPAGWSGYPEIAFLALVQCALLIAVWQETRRWQARLAATVLLLLTVAELVFLYSRMATLAAVAVLAVASLRAFRRGHARLYAAIVLVVVAITAAAVSRNQMARDVASSTVGIGTVQATPSMRLDIWQRSGRLVADHPWAGVGYGNFMPVFHARYQNRENWDRGRPVHAHNLWLHQAAEVGIPGGLVYAAFWVGLLVVGTRRVLGRGGATTAQCAAFLVLTGIAIRSLVDNMFFAPGEAAGRLHSLTWLFVALLLAGDRARSFVPAGEPEGERRPPAVPAEGQRQQQP